MAAFHLPKPGADVPAWVLALAVGWAVVAVLTAVDPLLAAGRSSSGRWSTR